MASGGSRWSDLSDTSLLLFVLAKCGAVIPYGDIAKHYGTTYAAVRSRFDRMRRKYKNEVGVNPLGAGIDDDDDEEAPPTPKKRKRVANAGENPAPKKQKKSKAVKIEEDDEADDEN